MRWYYITVSILFLNDLMILGGLCKAISYVIRFLVHLYFPLLKFLHGKIYFVVYSYMSFNKCKEVCIYSNNPDSEHIHHFKKLPCDVFCGIK